MKNPFKYGTIVDDSYFTDRVQELAFVKQSMNSDNHLVLISPRRFGKSSLVGKALKEIGRPFLMMNLQRVINVEDFSSKLLREVFRLYPWERLRHLMSHFRIVPTISSNPVTNGVDVSFQPMVDSSVLLEDAMMLLERISTEDRRLIVVFDEFQEIMSIGKGLDKQLRAIMQEQKNLNYILLGSQESMMTEIFERKKSPFYHFGKLMHLGKIPYDDFSEYIEERLQPVSKKECKPVVESILTITRCHPYYTQQLASQVWELMYYEQVEEDVVEMAVERITSIHDLDFERLWQNFNQTDKRIMLSLSCGLAPMHNRQIAPSTQYSSIKKLMKAGFVIRTENYEVEDPFFKRWIESMQR